MRLPHLRLPTTLITVISAIIIINNWVRLHYFDYHPLFILKYIKLDNIKRYTILTKYLTRFIFGYSYVTVRKTCHSLLK